MQTRVDGKSAYFVESTPDSFANVSKVANFDFFRILGNCC